MNSSEKCGNKTTSFRLRILSLIFLTGSIKIVAYLSVDQYQRDDFETNSKDTNSDRYNLSLKINKQYEIEIQDNNNFTAIEPRRRKLVSFETPKINADDPTSPQLAWLMTFPNSGTTYTMSLIQQVTETTVANVYGSAFYSKDENVIYKNIFDSIPVYQDRLSGPFFFSNYDAPKSPNSFILTKTHCSGYCTDCAPSRYISGKVVFFQGCRTGAKIKVSDAPQKKNGVTPNDNVKVEYLRHDPTLIKRAVHIFRNPLDNIGARFHHMLKLGRTENLENIQDMFNFDFTGFHEYCHYLDSKFWDRDSEWYTKQQLELAKKIPCHAEFYKYIQWHNLAFSTTEDIMEDIPVLVVLYEHYHHHLGVTVDRLMRFLGLDKLNNPPKFDFNRYLFYTEEEKQNIYLFMKLLASEETWNYVEPYCDHERGSKDLCNFIMTH